MKRFIEGEDRSQATLLPEFLDDYIAEDNPVRVFEAFVEELDLHRLGFDGMERCDTGRPSYHPSVPDAPFGVLDLNQDFVLRQSTVAATQTESSDLLEARRLPLCCLRTDLSRRQETLRSSMGIE